MTGLLLAFLIVILVPLFVATWRTSLLGLAVQGLLLGWLALGHEALAGADAALASADLLLVRALVTPVLLYRTMRALGAAPRHDVIAPNLFSWALVVALVVVAFRLADALVPEEGDAQLLVAAAAAAFALGLFVLAMARGTFSQIVGVLRIENAVALFEIGGRAARTPGASHAPPALEAALTAVLLVTVLYYRWYLANLDTAAEPGPQGSSIAL